MPDLVITNALSLNMLPENFAGKLEIKPISRQVALSHGRISAIGHIDLAALLGLPASRQTVKFAYGDMFIVAQYIGQRLPEGATELPRGAKIVFYLVKVTR